MRLTNIVLFPINENTEDEDTSDRKDKNDQMDKIVYCACTSSFLYNTLSEDSEELSPLQYF